MTEVGPPQPHPTPESTKHGTGPRRLSEPTCNGATRDLPRTEPGRVGMGVFDETGQISLTGTIGVQDGDRSRVGRDPDHPSARSGRVRTVYLAHDDDLDRPVAIKVPNPERITRPEDVEAFLIEARILAKLDHPNIVPVFDVGRTEDGLCFVVSKLVEGSDLAVRMDRARPSFRDSAQLVATIADALHYAHTRGLVHRDIKPANILIDAVRQTLCGGLRSRPQG